jgi:hypothetical protein
VIGRTRLLPVLLLVALAHADLAAANPGVRPLKVDFLDGYVELGVRGRNDRRTRSNAGTDFEGDQVSLDEILYLESAGSVWYPRLLRYRASLDLHFVQRLTGEGDNLFLPGGGLRLNFLEKKPYGLTVFGRVAEDEIEETFGRNFESRLTSYGGGIRFLLGPVPFRVRYTHIFRERTGDPRAELTGETDEVEFFGNYRFREGSDGDIRYRYSDETLRGQPSQRHDFTANNVTYFDPEKRKRFTGNVRYYDWSGRTDTSEASVYGTYDWRHTDDLTSRYHFDYAHRTFDQLSSDAYDARAAVSHQLYGSLFSTASVFANFQDASAGDVGEYGLEIIERYTKNLGRWGRLGVGLGPFVRLQQLRPDEGSAFVVDERHTFPVSDRVELRQLDIEIGSIVVTSPNGAITYDEGFDYIVNPIDRRTELVRVDTGTIPVDGQIHVDYRYEARAENDVLSFGTRGDLDWSYRDWGTFFARFTVKREDVVAGRSDRRLDNRDRQEFGFRTRQRWVSALALFDWEKWDVRDSNGNLQQISLSTPWPGIWRASVSTTHRWRHFTNPDEKLDSWRVLGNFVVQLGRNGTIELDPEYSREKWKSEEKVDGRDLESIGGTLALRWFYRSLEFRGGLSIFRIKRPGVTGLYDNFFFRVRRHF